MSKSEKWEAERVASRIANLAHLSDAELVKRALDEERSVSSYRMNHYAASPNNAYRAEVQRRQLSA